MNSTRRNCPSCGYDLRGNETGYCPECGEDLNNPARPPGNPKMLLAIVGAILCSMIIIFPLVWYLNRYFKDLGL